MLQYKRLPISALPRQSSDLKSAGFCFENRMKTDWHSKVYRKKKRAFMNQDEWQKLRKAVFERDDFTCQRCDKRNGQGRGLSAHHLMPRSEGGADDIENLITLCNSCHDLVEINELRTKADIQGSYDGGYIEMPKEKTEKVTDEGYHFIHPDWHKYVYGGAKREN